MRLRSVPTAFRHGGFVLGDAFTEFEALSKEQRDTLRDFHGRYIRVHPEDLGELTKLGLRLEADDVPLVDTAPPKAEKTNPVTAKAEKAVEKKD